MVETATIGTGSAAPDFTLNASSGRTIRLSDLKMPVVLYFFPKADTPG